MKNVLIILFLLLNINLFAQCPTDIKVDNITLPTCGNANGKFHVKITNISGNIAPNIEVSIDSGITFVPASVTDVSFTGLKSNIYHIIVRTIGSKSICQSFNFILRSDYGKSYTATPTSSSNCSSNGSIILGGGVLPTDSVSWLSNLDPIFITVGHYHLILFLI